MALMISYPGARLGSDQVQGEPAEVALLERATGRPTASELAAETPAAPPPAEATVTFATPAAPHFMTSVLAFEKIALIALDARARVKSVLVTERVKVPAAADAARCLTHATHRPESSFAPGTVPVIGVHAEHEKSSQFRIGTSNSTIQGGSKKQLIKEECLTLKDLT